MLEDKKVYKLIDTFSTIDPDENYELFCWVLGLFLGKDIANRIHPDEIANQLIESNCFIPENYPNALVKLDHWMFKYRTSGEPTEVEVWRIVRK